MQSRRNVNFRISGVMAALCMVWGMQQVAIKGISDEISPVLQVSIRSGVAAILVWILMVIKNEPLSNSRHHWLAGCMVGGLFALEFLFVAEGLKFTSASHMAVFLYTAPAFAAIGLQWFHPDERLSRGQGLGVLIAFVGIAVAFLTGDTSVSNIRMMLTGDLLGILAGLAWAATTIVVRCSKLSQAPATHTLFFQLVGACFLLFFYAMLTDQLSFTPKLTGTLSMIFQVFVVGFASYLTWFKLMKTYLASQLGILSFMTPVFGVLAGMLFLKEQPQTGFIWGTLLILSGISVVSGWPWLKTKFNRLG